MNSRKSDYLFTGISPNLSVNAKGHFGTYHQQFYKIIKKNHSIRYLGTKSELSNAETWYEQALPRYLGRPRPRLKKSDIGLLQPERNKINNENQIFFIYEGSLFWLLVANLYLEKNPNNFFVLNLFNSKKISDRFEKSIFRNVWIAYYRKLVNRTAPRILISYDNEKYGELLKNVFEENVVTRIRLLPSIETKLESNTKVSNDADKTLIVIRGKSGTDTLARIASRITDSSRLIIHGLAESTINKMGLINSEISDHFDQFEKYVELYGIIDTCVFLYDSEDFKYQSSGRLLDCLVSGNRVSVPINTALSSEISFGDSQIHQVHRNDWEIVNFINTPDLSRGDVPTFKKYLNEFESDLGEVLEIVSSTRILPQDKRRRLLLHLSVFFYKIISFWTLEGRLNSAAVRDYFVVYYRQLINLIPK